MNLPVFPSRPECRLCELCTNVAPNGHIGVPTSWLAGSLPPSPENKPLLLVGMNPGAVESLKNEPFLGKSGQLIRGPLLKGMDLYPLASIYLGNVARCITPKSAPKDVHYNSCFPHLFVDLHEIYRVHAQPVTIMLLGAGPVKTAWKYIFGSKASCNLKRVISHPRTEATLDGVPVVLFATVHPAFILRNRPAIHTAADHFALVADHLADQWVNTSKPHFVPPRPPRITKPF